METKFKHPFQVAEGSNMVYNLKPTGRYLKGEPEMANDIMIQIHQQTFGGRRPDETSVKEVAQEICNHLNVVFVVQGEETDESE